MEFFRLYGKEIVATLVPFIAWVLNVGFKAKARLQYSLPHTWRFIVQEPWMDGTGNQVSPTQTVQTGSIYLRNPGRETATNVEVVLNWEPTTDYDRIAQSIEGWSLAPTPLVREPSELIQFAAACKFLVSTCATTVRDINFRSVARSPFRASSGLLLRRML